jgi:ABC-type branched-subunit amino acid transport system ATPase component/ABC-type branched-subunit amino acid transport system permease subunit
MWMELRGLRSRAAGLGRRVSVSARLGVLGAAAALAVAIPLILPSYWVTIATLAVVGAILAMGLNLLMGYTGLDSLCQASFFGLGAYGLAILTVKQGVGWWPAALAAVAIGTAAAAVMGAIAVRLRGLYFLLVTVAMGQVLWGADYRWGTFTGGANGLPLAGGRPSALFYADANFYYFTLAVFAIIAGLVYVITVSPFGLTLRGIRDREIRSETLGYVTYTHKWIAFVLAGILASVAGVLNASYNGIASPSDLSLDQSFTAMLMVILGGAGTMLGPIAGAVLITTLRYQLSTLWADYWPIILGAIYLVTTLYLPDGVVRGVGRLLRSTAAPVKVESPEAVDVGLPPPKQRASCQSSSRTTREGSRTGQSSTAGAGFAVGYPRPALVLTGVSKSFGDVRALSDVSFTVAPGERVGIIGLNGAGKTTLFHVISGLERPTLGRVVVFGRDVTGASPSQRAALGLSRTFQVTLLYPTLTVEENIAVALLGSTYRRYRFRLWRPLRAHGYLSVRSRELLEAAGLWAWREVEVRHLSYGHQRQLEIALALAPDPALLLLDEPTAGLSQVEIASMRRLLASLPRDLTVLVVEHHLQFIFEFVDRVLVLHQGSIIMDGSPDAVRESDRVQALYFGKALSRGGSEAIS